MVKNIIDLNGTKDIFIEPELRLEYIKKLEKIRKGKYIQFKSVEDLNTYILN